MRQDFKHTRLRKTHVDKFPGRVLYFDTETWSEDKEEEQHHRMDIAWTCYAKYDDTGECEYERWEFWNTKKGICEYIRNKAYIKKPLLIIAHNIFFDLQVIGFFRSFAKWGYKLDFYYDKGLTYILIIRHEGRVIKCISSTNYYQSTLKRLGSMLGVNKLEIDFDQATRDELIEYCKRDVLVLKSSIEHFFRFIHKHDLGKVTMTKASQAMTAYRKKFLSEKIYYHHEEGPHDLERSAYYGGRTECFQIGEIKDGPFQSYDFNSMYPFVMANNHFPIKLVEHRPDYTITKIEAILGRYSVIAEVWVDTPEPVYAVRHNGKIVFPTGTFRTYLCSGGLEYAIKHDHILKVGQTNVYKSARLFDDYVDYFTTLKQHYTKTNNKIMRQLTKDFLNSLYGKFASRKPEIVMTDLDSFTGFEREDIYNLVTGQKGINYKMFNTAVAEYGWDDEVKSLCAIASHITEYGRLELWSLIKQVGYDRALYCDTDSLKIRKKDSYRIRKTIHDSELGALCMEEEFNNLHIYAAKSYVTEHHRVLKGVPKRAEEISPGMFTYDTFLRQGSHMRKGVDDYFILRRTVKVLKNVYDKATVRRNGRCTPFIFAEKI